MTDRSDAGDPEVAPADRSRSGTHFHGLIGRTRCMRRIYERIECLAPSGLNVLIRGESGTGKELAARAIHRIDDASQPLVAVNCAALPETLVESELFGHVRGAFTGASRDSSGLLARADGGILFLDEIGDLPPPAQAKLLRVIETGDYRPVGSNRVEHSDFRLIAATNGHIQRLTEQSEFRIDLFHRLGAARIHMPPLRERADDVPLLAAEFLSDHRRSYTGGGPDRFTPAAIDMLRAASWPGNVRQLKHVVETAAVLTSGPAIRRATIASVFAAWDGSHAPSSTLPRLEPAVQRFENRLIRDALRRTGGDIEEAAGLLGVSRSTIYRRLERMSDGEDGTDPGGE